MTPDELKAKAIEAANSDPGELPGYKEHHRLARRKAIEAAHPLYMAEIGRLKAELAGAKTSLEFPKYSSVEVGQKLLEQQAEVTRLRELLGALVGEHEPIIVEFDRGGDEWQVGAYCKGPMAEESFDPAQMVDHFPDCHWLKARQYLNDANS
jgi:hypothetical protein